MLFHSIYILITQIPRCILWNKQMQIGIIIHPQIVNRIGFQNVKNMSEWEEFIVSTHFRKHFFIFFSVSFMEKMGYFIFLCTIEKKFFIFNWKINCTYTNITHNISLIELRLYIKVVVIINDDCLRVSIVHVSHLWMII